MITPKHKESSKNRFEARPFNHIQNPVTEVVFLLCISSELQLLH